MITEPNWVMCPMERFTESVGVLSDAVGAVPPLPIVHANRITWSDLQAWKSGVDFAELGRFYREDEVRPRGKDAPNRITPSKDVAVSLRWSRSIPHGPTGTASASASPHVR